MYKKLVLLFCCAFVIVLVGGIFMQDPSALQAEQPQPFPGLILGMLYGVQFGMLIPLLAWWTIKGLKRKDLYFVSLFAVECGVTLGQAVLFGVWGFPLVGLMFLIGKIIVVCIIYTLTCRWWKKQPG